MQLSDFATYAGYFLGILIIVVLAGTFRAPLKWIFRLCLSSVMGCIIITVINHVFANTGFYVGINPITAVFMGILGLPGTLALVVLRLII